ncbi:hypothetical protein Bbelb_053850 [Branchiostoma belcheri]|nr:hypothetical protein Bbelb_053850 [Branchiostoma belcheri]
MGRVRTRDLSGDCVHFEAADWSLLSDFPCLYCQEMEANKSISSWFCVTLAIVCLIAYGNKRRKTLAIREKATPSDSTSTGTPSHRSQHEPPNLDFSGSEPTRGFPEVRGEGRETTVPTTVTQRRLAGVLRCNN